MSKTASKGVANSNNDIKRWIGQKVIVKFVGGREVTGLLRGYDTLVNLVLDDCVETIRDPQVLRVCFVRVLRASVSRFL